MVTRDQQSAIAEPPSFDLCGGHPVLDFVNSLDNRFNEQGRIEGLGGYGDLLRFAGQAGLLDSAQVQRLAGAVDPSAGARALRAARGLREALAATLYAIVDGRSPPSSDLETIEHYCHAADHSRSLLWREADGHRGLSWSWPGEEGNAQLPVWVLARAAIDLLLSPQMDRVRACEASTCRWLFLDTSKNRTRRWCNMKVCGNRMKARRYQTRHQ